ncbi:hypothetical protein [Streptacidiphilus albus]|uniref:hypothetical protein n=1 Tax=Streptacidiphilus albus TaxID=105425 RepID=UPI00054C77D9|nr:hypothetical protein [Streptacidiphilus albus]
MALLARLGTLAMGKEASGAPGTYVTPTVGIPYTGSSGFEDVIAQLRDESVRADDSVLHGSYQGPAHSEWSIDVLAYPDLAPWFFAAVIGPDVVTAGTSTTLSVGTAAGAKLVSLPVSLAAGTPVRLDSAALQEYAVTVGAPTGTGPYVHTVTTVAGQSVGLAYAHAASVVVQTPTIHTFRQNPAVLLPTYSFTYFDTVAPVSCSYVRFSDLQMKIDPKASVSLSVKAIGFPSVPQTAATGAYTAYDPWLGWSWTQTIGGAASTRGLSYDATFKRATEAIAGSDGTQAPREVFAAALEYDGTLKCVYENSLDLALFLGNTQLPLVMGLQQPISRGGQSLTLTSSKSAAFKGKRDLSGPYAAADFSVSGVANTTDGGVVQAVVQNWQTTAY